MEDIQVEKQKAPGHAELLNNSEAALPLDFSLGKIISAL